MDEDLYAHTLETIDALTDLLSEFGVSNSSGNEVPALVLFLPSLTRITEFVVMHRQAAARLAVLQARERPS